MSLSSFRAVAALALLMATAASAQYRPPQHTQSPPLIDKLNQYEIAIEARRGTTIETARSATWQLAEHRRLSAALARVGPGRKDVVDAFVLAVGLDSDPVFGREAREAGRVLARRYAATARTIVLAGSDGNADSDLPNGSPANIAAALARIAELMGPEDVLILYTTSHGAPFGIVYNDSDAGFGIIGPAKLASMLTELNIRNRMLLISACYSGVFVGPLVTPTTAILTAASTDRTSFGCKADNDWTFFGDALINHALRKPQPFAAAEAEAIATIAGWEQNGALTPSLPQSYVGADAAKWLATLEKTLPPATAPVGKPATDALK
jgi:hypothetical protein